MAERFTNMTTNVTGASGHYDLGWHDFVPFKEKTQRLLPEKKNAGHRFSVAEMIAKLRLAVKRR
ncbi:MAG: hypothetical protein ACPGRX_02145 [Bdellovibrionales bacterium]